MEPALLVIIASKKQDPRYWYCQPKEALACDMAVDVHVRVPCPSEFVRFRVPVPPNDWRIILARKTNQRGNKANGMLEVDKTMKHRQTAHQEGNLGEGCSFLMPPPPPPNQTTRAGFI